MREKSVWQANRCFIDYSIKWIIVYWHNKNKHVVHFSNICLKSVNIGLAKTLHIAYATPILFTYRPK